MERGTKREESAERERDPEATSSVGLRDGPAMLWIILLDHIKTAREIQQLSYLQEDLDTLWLAGNSSQM